MSEDQTPVDVVPDEPAAESTPEPTAEPTPEPTPERRPDPLRHSRTSGLYAAVVGLAVVLLLLIIFIAQNTRRVQVSFLAWDGRVPVAVALLIATVAGMFLVLLAGTLRILQLRRRVRRERKAKRR